MFHLLSPRLAQAVEALGAGELLLNCINRDGQGNGYELELIQQVKWLVVGAGGGLGFLAILSVDGPCKDFAGFLELGFRVFIG